MNVNFLIGRAGSGKSQYVYQSIKDAINEGHEKIILLVPEQYTLQAEADLITKMKLPGILDLDVLSFRRLAYRILTEVGGIKKVSIDQTGKMMMLRKIFEEHAQQLLVFNKSYNEEGFLKEFSALLSECKRNNITAENLASMIEIDECDDLLKDKLSDVLLIGQKFEESLTKSYIDEDDQLTLVVEKMDQSEWLSGAKIWIDGFHSFSSQEYQILEKLFDKAESVSISLTLDPHKDSRDYDLFEPPQNTYQKIKDLLIKRDVQVDFLPFTGSFRSKALSHAEQNFYAYPYIKYQEEQEEVSIFSALNPYSEVENVATSIIKLVRDDGYQWKDIVMVTNDLAKYSPIVRRVFAEYGIPVFTDEKKDVLSNPLISYISSFLKIISYDYRYDDVFQHLKTGFSQLNTDEVEELENYVLEYGIHGYRWKKDFENETVNQNRKIMVTPLEKNSKKMKKKNKVSVFSELLFSYLTETAVYETLDKEVEFQKESGSFDLANENGQIWNMMIAVLDQAVEMLGDTEISLAEYITLLETGFSGLELGMIPPTMDQVMLGNLERSKSHDSKALFLLGANDGLIPKAFEDKGIFVDDEKIQMKHLGMDLTSDHSYKVKAEKFLIYSMISKPSEKLFISYSIGDLQGKSMRPSIIIERFKKIFPIIVKSDILPDLNNISELMTLPGPTFKYLLENLRRYIDHGSMSEDWWTVYQWYYKNDSWKEMRHLLVSGLFYSVQEKEDNSNKADLYTNTERFSISRFETFKNCPFKHFVSYGLKPEPRKEFELKMPDLGTLYHDALEEFSRKIKDENLSWNEIATEKAEHMIEEILSNMTDDFQNGVLESNSRTKYMKEKVMRVSKRAIQTLTHQLQSGKFIPFEYEIPFSDKTDKESSLPALVVTLPDGHEIRIEGRIDRLDIYKTPETTYFRVIDYKSGNKKFSIADFYHQIQLQLIVYLWAALEGASDLLEDNTDPAGAFYFKIDDPLIESENDTDQEVDALIEKELKMDGLILSDVSVAKAMDDNIEQTKESKIMSVSLNKDDTFSQRSQAFSKEEIDDLIAYARKSTADIAHDILGGNIKIEPYKKGSFKVCQHCDYHAICQFDQRFADLRYKNLETISKKEALLVIKAERGEN